MKFLEKHLLKESFEKSLKETLENKNLNTFLDECFKKPLEDFVYEGFFLN